MITKLTVIYSFEDWEKLFLKPDSSNELNDFIVAKRDKEDNLVAIQGVEQKEKDNVLSLIKKTENRKFHIFNKNDVFLEHVISKKTFGLHMGL